MNAELSHEHLSHLLPWYANGTLSPEEHALLEQHLKTCGVCERELQWLRNVNSAMTDLDEEVPDVNASFAKTLAAVDSLETPKPLGRRQWLAGWFDTLWNPSIPFARLVFAAQLALILGLGIYSLALRETSPGFVTLSGSDGSTGGVRLTVNFAPSTTVAQMNQSLSAIGGRIVSGPSASGMYVVELPIGAEKDTQVQTVIDKLRTNGAIRFVERQP